MLQAHNPIYVWVPEGSVLVKHATIDTLLSSYNQERMRMSTRWDSGWGGKITRWNASKVVFVKLAVRGTEELWNEFVCRVWRISGSYPFQMEHISLGVEEGVV